jgi:protocatechuate 3,4-dioxygenase alpha subunit
MTGRSTRLAATTTRDRQPGKAIDASCGWAAVSDFETGVWLSFDTIKPGSVVGRNGRPMAPHITPDRPAVNLGLNTCMYFSRRDHATPVIQC